MVEVDCEYLRFSQVPQILMILDTNRLVSHAGGGSGPRVRTSKDIDSVRFIKPGQSGCCGMQNGFPVDN